MSGEGPTYRDLIARGAVAHADRTAMIVADRAYSFAEVEARANRLAHAFVRVGVGKGARVAVLLNNGADSIPLDFAIAKAGLNKVPLNARLSPDEHLGMVRGADCAFLVFGPGLDERAAELAAGMPELACLGLGTCADGSTDLAAVADGEIATAPEVAIDPDDVVVTLYTSGTTGVLKAAQHTQGSYAAICRNVLLNLFAIEPDDRMLHAASLIHASGTFVLPLWLRGACSVVLPGFVPGEYLAAIALHRVTALNLVPTMLGMLLDDPALDEADVSSLRHIIYGASPMPRPLIQRAIAHFGQHRFWQYFGQTEAPLCLAVLRPEDHRPDLFGACGRPAIDVALRLTGEDRRDVGQGPGEIEVRTPSAAIGYYKADELSTETFADDGWVRTRDIGRIDDRGYLHLLDRSSDMIITGGYNVYPREVEEAVLSHPAVAAAAVVGAPDATWVEAVIAFVVLRPDASASEDEIIAHVAARIAGYKKPQRVLFEDELPVTVVGKLDRKSLRSRFPRIEEAH